MYAIVNHVAPLVVAPPDLLVAADLVGVRAPMTLGYLPTRVVSLTIERAPEHTRKVACVRLPLDAKICEAIGWRRLGKLTCHYHRRVP